jgi:hypothetical protein
VLYKRKVEVGSFQVWVAISLALSSGIVMGSFQYPILAIETEVGFILKVGNLRKNGSDSK